MEFASRTRRGHYSTCTSTRSSSLRWSIELRVELRHTKQHLMDVSRSDALEEEFGICQTSGIKNDQYNMYIENQYHCLSSGTAQYGRSTTVPTYYSKEFLFLY